MSEEKEEILRQISDLTPLEQLELFRELTEEYGVEEPPEETEWIQELLGLFPLSLYLGILIGVKGSFPSLSETSRFLKRLQEKITPLKKLKVDLDTYLSYMDKVMREHGDLLKKEEYEPTTKIAREVLEESESLET